MCIRDRVYLKYIAPEDIVVYSIDEVFMDVTDYLNTYKPVSYTHLDVYKRQVCALRDCRLCTGTG